MAPRRRRAPALDVPVSAARDVQDQTLELHAELRDALRRAWCVAHRVKAGDVSGHDPLRDAAADLVVLVRRHVDIEERFEPVLRELDAWGELRCERLRALHEREEEVVADPDGAGGQAFAPELELAATLCRVVVELLRCVRAEERQLLDPALVEGDYAWRDPISS